MFVARAVQAVVVDGTVVGMTGSVNEGTVEVEVLKYLCGCGREKITVTGLRSTSLCGPGIPTVKTRAVFFLCPSDDGSVYRANDITLHTGWVANQNGNLENATTESELACAQAPLTPGECAGQNLQPRMCQNIRAARVVKPDEFDEF